VLDARWARRDDLSQYQLTEKATSVILEAFDFFERLSADPTKETSTGGADPRRFSRG